MKMVRLYLRGWRRMLYVKETRSGGALLLEPTAGLRSVRMSKQAYAATQAEAVAFDERWVRAHLRVWAKAARKAKRLYARAAVREVLKPVE